MENCPTAAARLHSQAASSAEGRALIVAEISCETLPRVQAGAHYSHILFYLFFLNQCRQQCSWLVFWFKGSFSLHFFLIWGKKYLPLSTRRCISKFTLSCGKRKLFWAPSFSFPFWPGRDKLCFNEKFCQYEWGRQKFHNIIELINQTIVCLQHQPSGKWR